VQLPAQRNGQGLPLVADAAALLMANNGADR
jgi:hypothetical protein